MSGPQEQRRKQRCQRDRVVAKALHNRDETREKLLAQGRELARRRAENLDREQDRNRGKEETTSTKSGVHSTMPSMDTNEEAAARRSHSTVPARPKGSTVPAARRLYGRRLYRRIRVEDDETDRAGQSDPEPGSGSDGEGKGVDRR